MRFKERKLWKYTIKLRLQINFKSAGSNPNSFWNIQLQLAKFFFSATRFFMFYNIFLRFSFKLLLSWIAKTFSLLSLTLMSTTRKASKNRNIAGSQAPPTLPTRLGARERRGRSDYTTTLVAMACNFNSYRLRAVHNFPISMQARH